MPQGGSVAAMPAIAPIPLLTLACTVCDSAASRQVRAGLGADDLVINLLAVVLPFAASAGVVALVYLWPLTPRARREDRP